ncbi:MAG: gluconate kinase [Frankiales bacterium]|nr:gluconate kinase [Frankiales bacterium]
MKDFCTAETHLSWLVLLGDRVLKVKKPVRTEFIDLTTREARERNAQCEVLLNQRLSPDVYLGVAHLAGADGLDEPVVVMRRMPEDRRLALLAARGDRLDEPVRRLARLVADFHRTVPVVPGAGSTEVVAGLWEAGGEQLVRHGRDVVGGDEVRELVVQATRYVRGRPALFDGRADRVRDGHGDLLADDVFLLDDGPRVLDCLEFDPALRAGDVLADVAFLAMDLERLGRRDLAELLLSEHRAALADDWPSSLADHWIAYRAFVRAKVACLRAEQSDPASAALARDHLALARRRMRFATVKLVLVGGSPGTGKTTLARALCSSTGWELLRSDVVRKELAGVAEQTSAAAPPGAGLYSQEHGRRTLDELLARARALLSQGRSVVLDATWAAASWRAAAEALAVETGSELVCVRAVVDDAVADARLAARTGDASDATPATAALLRPGFEDWPQARVVTTDRPADELAGGIACGLLEP